MASSGNMSVNLAVLVSIVLLHTTGIVRAEDEWGHGRYQYKSLSGTPTVFTAKTPIEIDYLGELMQPQVFQSVDVERPNECHFEPGFSTRTPTRVRCPQPGIKKFHIGQDDVYITIESAGLCYSWYVAIAGNLTKVGDAFDAGAARYHLGSLDAGQPGEMRIWIIDHLRADANELATTATLPSSISKQITQEHFNLGERPSVETLSLAVDAKVSNYVGTWIAEGGYWRVLFTGSQQNSYAVSVTGRDVTVLGCGVGERTLEMSVRSQNTFIVESTAATVSAVQVQRDACRPTVAIARVNAGLSFYYTQLNFKDTEHVRLESSELGAASALEAVVLTQRTLVVLADTGLFVSSDSASFTHSKLKLANGTLVDALPAKLDRLTASQSCDRLQTRSGDPSPLNDYSYSWSSLKGETTFYQSLDGGYSFSEKRIDMYGDATVIYAVSILHNYPHNFALVATNTSTVQFIQFETDTDKLTVGHEFPANLLVGENGEAPQVTMSLSGSGEVFVYGETLFFSPDGGRTAHQITLESRDAQRPGPSLVKGERVAEVVTSLYGGFAVRTSSNRVFYGQNDLATAIEVASGLHFSATSFLHFNSIGDLTAYEPIAARPYFKGYVIPRINEITSPRAPRVIHQDEVCPYLTNLVDAKGQNYLDMNEVLNITTTITPRAGYSASASVIVSDNNLVAFSRIEESAVRVGETIRQTQITQFSERSSTYSSFEERRARARGEAAIRLAPRAANLACPKIRNLARVRVGCPLNRHIRFKKEIGSREHCGKYESGNYVYEIPGGVYNREGLKDFGSSKRNLFREYDYAKYGCPMRVFHGTPGYRPTLELWDGDTYVKDVDANFVVFDVNGRFDFSYNATNKIADCKIEPQTRQMMQRTTGLNASENWTPYNYVSCFGPGERIRYDSWKKTAYEILNSTGPNALRFLPTGRDGIFIFQARILDPDYSYCELTTEFALEVFGAPLSALLILMILLIVLAAVLGFLGISYVYYRKKKLHLD